MATKSNGRTILYGIDEIELKPAEIRTFQIEISGISGISGIETSGFIQMERNEILGAPC